MTRIIVLAKSPVPGHAKTRLSPPCTPAQAARIAEASLSETLGAATSVERARTVVVLDGQPGSWLPPDADVVHQRGDGLDERISAAFADVGAPALIIGMDTPQVSRALLTEALEALSEPGTDAVLGGAPDGGWWCAGLRRDEPRAFAGVPMSSPGTLVAQRHRWRELGLRFAELPRLRDVDTLEDAVAVARAIPHSRFSRIVKDVLEELVTTSYAPGPRRPAPRRRSTTGADARFRA